MYRATGNTRYLELSQNLINIRGMVENGTDDNQDRIPFREQYNAMGHAVRSNYLYAGVADVYAETGEEQLMKNLTSIWSDIVNRKMYVTGACGALYDGTSPDGTFYEPDSIQKVHQSYGRPYQLPNSTAHNETCANIGNMLFNWRMLEITGDAKYAEIVETALYNSVLSGISLDGLKYFYTNPLRISADCLILYAGLKCVQSISAVSAVLLIRCVRFVKLRIMPILWRIRPFIVISMVPILFRPNWKDWVR